MEKNKKIIGCGKKINCFIKCGQKARLSEYIFLCNECKQKMKGGFEKW